MALQDIKNFLSIGGGIATAGQPSEEQLREVAASGFETVINLGLLDPRYCLADEAALVRSLALNYVHIPVDFQVPQLADLKNFFEHMDSIAGEKVFVHCAANYRVTTFVGLYAQSRWGWSSTQADELIKKWWEPNEVWSDFVEQVRSAFPNRE